MIRHGPWTIAKSIKKYESNRVLVIEDHVICPNGQHASYTTINIEPSVCVLPLDNDGIVYLVRDFRYALGRETIEAVGGPIRADEDPIAAGERELHERLGLRARTIVELGHVDVVTSIIRSATRLYLARELSVDAEKPDGAAQLGLVRVPLTEALRMADRNEITHAETCTLLLRACRYLDP